MYELNGVSILNGADLKTAFEAHGKQMEMISNSLNNECAIKGCNKQAVAKWRDTSERYNVCEFHETIMEKERFND